MSSFDSNLRTSAFTLKFKSLELESEFLSSYDKGIKEPLRLGIIISMISWYGAIGLIYFIIPEDIWSLGSFTFIYITSFFAFIIYATYRQRFEGYYQLLGAFSNAWAGIFAIYFCDQFPEGEHLILPVHIFIVFFGLYMIRLRWIAGFIAAITYTVAYSIYLMFTDLSDGQILLYVFVSWMTLVFAMLAGRATEHRTRVDFIQRRTIKQQSEIIEKEKNLLLKEVHHRVKNNLQIIVSLIKLQNSKEKNKDAASALADIQKRVMSMSLVHQKMHQASNYEEISVLDYVAQVVDNIKEEEDQNAEINLEIPDDIYLNMEAAIPFGLIINELITNFFNHVEASSNGVKSCTIKIKKESGKTIKLIYKDSGVGFAESMQIINDQTIGLELIDSLSEQLSGNFQFYNDGGAVCEIRLNLEE